MAGMSFLLNLCVILLFFYMAASFDGKLLTSYKECFDKLQELQVFAKKENHSMERRGTLFNCFSSLQERAQRQANAAARDADFYIVGLL